MKKFILAALVVCASVSANAQVWLGGSLGWAGAKPAGDGQVTTNVFTISPEIGYTLSDKWDIAVGINEQIVACDGETANTFTIAPYARYTFAKAGIASFFVDGGFTVGSSNYSNGKKLSDSQTAWGIGLRPGVKIALSDKVSLVSKLGYLGYYNVKDSYSTWGFGVDNTQISLGMYWNF